MGRTWQDIDIFKLGLSSDILGQQCQPLRHERVLFLSYTFFSVIKNVEGLWHKERIKRTGKISKDLLCLAKAMPFFLL